MEEAFYVNLKKLFDPATLKVKKQSFTEVGMADTPYYDVHQRVPLWGATALITSEFIDITKKINL